MAKSLGVIPQGVLITDGDGAITDFFRLRWEELRNSFQQTPNVATFSGTGQKAAIVTRTLFTTTTDGYYRVSAYLRKTFADGVASSLTWTTGWTDRDGTALTEAGAALVTDTAIAQQSLSKFFFAKANTDITGAVAYASTTPNRMTYNADVVVEQMA